MKAARIAQSALQLHPPDAAAKRFEARNLSALISR